MIDTQEVDRLHRSKVGNFDSDDDETSKTDDWTASDLDSTSNSISTRSSAGSTPPSRSSGQFYLEKSWKRLKKKLRKILLNNDDTAPFKAVYGLGVPETIVIGIAKLVMRQSDGLLLDELAAYLAKEEATYDAKLGCIRVLIGALCFGDDQSWQIQEGALRETLDFVRFEEHDWALPQHSEHTLIHELRTRCVRIHPTRTEVENVVKGSEAAAESISDAAKLIERSLRWSTVVIHGGLEVAADSLKERMTPASTKLRSPPAKGTVVAYSTAVRLASDGMRKTAHSTFVRIRDKGSECLEKAVRDFERRGLAEKWIPSKDHRDMLCAAGKIGIASVGAAAIVGEAVVDTTRSVTQKTLSVTADVVGHKYGESAGRVLQDASDTTENVFRTFTYVATLNGKVMTRAVAKNSSKAQIVNESDSQADEELDPRTLLLGSTKAAAEDIVQKLTNKKPPSSSANKQAAAVKPILVSI